MLARKGKRWRRACVCTLPGENDRIWHAAPRDDIRKIMKPQPIPSDQFLEIEGFRFHYLDWGGSGFPLILIPGLGWTPHAFSQLAAYFVDSFHVLGFTKRGHGKTDQIPIGYDIPTLASDIGLFMSQLGLDSAHFIGHSMGGYEISQLASDEPARVSSITFLDCAWNLAEWVDDVPDPIAQITSEDPPTVFSSYEEWIEFTHRIRPDLKRIWSHTLDLAARSCLSFHEDGSVEEILSKEIESLLKQGCIGFSHAYDRIECPALAFYALYELDPKLPDNASDDLRKQSRKYTEQVDLPWIRDQMGKFKSGIRDSKVVELWNATHHCYIDHEDDVVREIREFLLV